MNEHGSGSNEATVEPPWAHLSTWGKWLRVGASTACVMCVYLPAQGLAVHAATWLIGNGLTGSLVGSLGMFALFLRVQDRLVRFFIEGVWATRSRPPVVRLHDALSFLFGPRFRERVYAPSMDEVRCAYYSERAVCGSPWSRVRCACWCGLWTGIVLAQCVAVAARCRAIAALRRAFACR